MTQPTPEYRRRHQVEAPAIDNKEFRQGWRVITKLDRLLADKRITRGQWSVGYEYKSAWSAAFDVSLPEFATVRVNSGNPSDGRVVAVLDLVNKLRDAEVAIGSTAAHLLLLAFVEDLSWAEIGRRYRRNPETARDWTVAALARLAEAWGGRNVKGVSRNG